VTGSENSPFWNADSGNGVNENCRDPPTVVAVTPFNDPAVKPGAQQKASTVLSTVQSCWQNPTKIAKVGAALNAESVPPVMVNDSSSSPIPANPVIGKLLELLAKAGATSSRRTKSRRFIFDLQP